VRPWSPGLKVLGVDLGALVTVGGISGLAIGLAGRQILENAFMGRGGVTTSNA